MTAPKPLESDLDRRLRRLHARLDTSADFEPRVLARVDGLRIVIDEKSRHALRERALLERLETEARLRRRYWLVLGVTIGAGILAMTVATIFGGEIGRLVAALGITRQWNPIALASVGLFAAGGWIAVQNATGFGTSRTELG